METKRKVTEITTKKPPSWLQSKLRVCAYVRVSTGHEKQLDSLENQTQYYERMIRNNPEFEYCGIFSDVGISGAKVNRPGFQAMITQAREGNIDLIYTKSISRFARNTILLLETVRELKSLGIGIIFEEQNINTLRSEGELMLTVLASIAEEERKSVSSNIRWAKRNKYKNGETFINTNTLLGYDKDKNGNIVINKEQAVVVHEIYKRYLAGESSYKIASDFNNEGISTFRKYPWTPNNVMRILSNEKFCGDIMMQKTFIGDDNIQRRSKGELERYLIHDHHPAIIDRKTWEIAQKIRTVYSNQFPLSHMLKCPYCGASLVHFKNHRWFYWRCNNRIEYGISVCQGLSIPEKVLNEIIKDISITEPMVVEEVEHGFTGKRKGPENYRLIPAYRYRFQQRG